MSGTAWRLCLVLADAANATLDDNQQEALLKALDRRVEQAVNQQIRMVNPPLSGLTAVEARELLVLQKHLEVLLRKGRSAMLGPIDGS